MQELQPENVFTFFEVISSIPRGSGNTKAISDFVAGFAKERGLDYVQDKLGNVLIRKGATAGYEEAPVVILQGHMDMVCAKTPESTHNFETDPLKLVVEDDYLYAEGTTLGGDDGIAVAYMLAILDDDEIAHPALECLFTVDEEIGLLGAAGLDASILKGKRMINLDSEDEGVFTVGCAGGIRVDSVIPVTRAVVRGFPVLAEIRGLKGGHSGEMIDKSRANALKLMGRLLYELNEAFAISLCDATGGEKDNAIPTLARARFVIDEDDFEEVKKYIDKFQASLRKEYAGSDEGITVTVEGGRTHKVSAMSPDSQDRVIGFLMQVPYGVSSMSGLTEGLIQTSNNVGIMRTGEDKFVSTSLVRSSVLSQRDAMAATIRNLTELLGGTARTKEGYPAWEFNPISPLRDTMVAVYQQMYEDDPIITVIHGGLECGIFYEKIEGLDAVSIGPDLMDIHTPGEKLSISSAQRVWNFLLSVLASLAA